MIRFWTERSGLSMDGVPMQNGFDEPIGEGDERLDELMAMGEEEPETGEMLVEGRLITTTHRVELVYEEELSSEFGPTLTRIGFDRACPEMITMLRSGAVNTAMVFEDRRRHICIYNAPAVGFEVCISTVKVENRLLDEGSLLLDYYMEIHGVQTEHCRIELTIQGTE